MNNFKKVGLTALAGSLAAVSAAQAGELGVSGAAVVTYTSEDTTEVTGNPFGMKSNVVFSGSGDLDNGWTMSMFHTMSDAMSAKSSSALAIDMGDMGTIRLDHGSGSGLSTIDDKTPSAAEESWDGLDTSGSGLVGGGNSGSINYIRSFGVINMNASYKNQGGSNNADGASSSGSEGSMIDAAFTTSSVGGVEGLDMGLGYGSRNNPGTDVSGAGDDTHSTIFANYTIGRAKFGYQLSELEEGDTGGSTQKVDIFGIAINLNDNLSVSYGEKQTVFDKTSGVDVEEKTEGLALSYTMGSMKIAGNRNQGTNMNGSTGASDEMTEIALSFAF